MELREQEKEIGMSSSLGYSSPNRHSSCKIPPASVVNSDFGARTRHHLNVTPQNLEHHLPLNLQHQTLKPARDLDLTPDPTPAPLPLSISGTSPTNTSPTPSGSPSRSPPPPVSTSSARYRECLRNHAASMGGLIIDGCGEFMPSGEEGTPEALKCAACECHRNFHRKEIDQEQSQCAAKCYNKNNNQRNTLPLALRLSPSLPLPQAPVYQYQGYHRRFSISVSTAPAAPMMMNFGGGKESSSEDVNMFQYSNIQGGRSTQPSSLKKRFRTKFSKEQKGKMMEFAERLGWTIQKQDEQEVQQFCSRIGVRRKVFKVWMHNNKQSMNKNQM